MALLSINQPRSKERGRDTLETIALGLQVANSVLGLGKTGVDIYKGAKEAAAVKPKYDAPAEMLKGGNPLVKPRGENSVVSFESLGRDPSKVDYLIKNQEDLDALSKATGAGQRYVSYQTGREEFEIDQARKSMERKSKFKEAIKEDWTKSTASERQTIADVGSIEDMIEQGNVQSIGQLATLVARKVGKDVGNLAEGDVRRALPASLQQDAAKWYAYFTGQATTTALSDDQKKALRQMVDFSKQGAIESMKTKLEEIKINAKGLDASLFKSEEAQDQLKAFSDIVKMYEKKAKGEDKKTSIKGTSDLLKNIRGVK